MNSQVTFVRSTSGASDLGLPSIAFIGKAGAGKTTSAELLTELGYTRLSFAAPLKDLAAQLWGDAARTDREKLQKLGVAVREIDADAWVNLLLACLMPRSHGVSKIDKNATLPPPRPWPGPFAIDDCRFPNEYWALKEASFVVVCVKASRHDRVDRLKSNGKWQDESQLEHVSETALDNIHPDHVIHNDGSKDDLYDQIVEVLLRERKRR